MTNEKLTKLIFISAIFIVLAAISIFVNLAYSKDTIWFPFVLFGLFIGEVAMVYDYMKLLYIIFL